MTRMSKPVAETAADDADARIPLDGATTAASRRRPRRSAGEGDIHLRKDGRWEARLDLGWVDGKRKRKSIFGRTREAVAKKLTRAVVDYQNHKPVLDERQTVGQYLKWWLQSVVQTTWRPKTYTSYESICRVHLIPGLGKHRLARLTAAHVQTFLTAKLGVGASANTVRYCRVVLRAALADALELDVVSRNAAATAKPPKVERRKVTPLTPAQARALLRVVEGHRLEALFTVAIALGLREGEALGLSWDDIDLHARTLTVRRQLQRVEKKLQLVEPKTEQSRRPLALPAIVVNQLRAHKVRQAEERLSANVWEDAGLVFASRYGTPIHPENLGRMLRPYLVKAECPPQRWHDLRHACASLLLAQGATMKVVQNVLGHTQLATTSEIYAHLYPEFREQVAAKMDAILAQ
jgi:integrase